MARKAVAHIEVEGQDKPLFPYHQVSISQQLFGHHEFEIQVPIQVIEGNVGNVINASRQLIGKTIKISIESEQIGDSQTQLFWGVITHLGFARSHGADSDIILRGNSTTIMLERGRHCRTFSEMSTTDIAKEVLGDYPANLLSYETGTNRQQQRLHTMQYQETDWQFLSRLANRIGAWFFYDGEKLYFDLKNDQEPVALTLGSDLHSFDLALGMYPVGDQYEGYQYLTNEFMSGVMPAASSLGLDTTYTQEVYETAQEFFAGPTQHQALLSFENQNELDKYAELRGSQQGSRMTTMRGNSENILVGLGSVISIAGSRSDDRQAGVEDYGKFTVVRVKHRINGNGNYQNMFESIPAEASIPPLNPSVKLPSLEPQPATVTDTHDPEGLGRVKVKFLWQGETPWIRVLTSVAGADRGNFFIPEIDDEVLIGFEYQDPDQPMVLGSLFHGNNKPNSAWDHPENDIKSIRTKSGNEIQIVDTAGEELIKINTGDGKNLLSLTMANGGTITMSSSSEISISSTTINVSASETLNMDANDININAGNKLAITSGADTTLDAGANLQVSSGSNTELSAGANLSTSSGANTEVAAGANLTLDATNNLTASAGVNAEISANANAKLAGTAMVSAESPAVAKLSGATVNVEGQMATNVTGGVIKLN